MPDRLNLQQLIFRINLIVTGIVFFLLMPTVRVYRWWYPGQKDSLWLFPAGVLVFSCVIWLIASLSIPLMIRIGVLEDLRKMPRPEEYSPTGKFLRILFPVLLTASHLALILFCAVSLITFLKQQPFQSLFTNVS